jgi:hypothetical protein
MKKLTYKRKAQFTSKIEIHTGVFALFLMKKHTNIVAIHPIMNGYICRGLVHTNAFDIKELN